MHSMDEQGGDMLVPQGDILIVDDNPDNLDLLGSVLRERQYRVRAVPSGAMALEAARRYPSSSSRRACPPSRTRP